MDTVADKATTFARDASENSLVFVYERDGVYWLAMRHFDRDGYRTLMAVGVKGCGIRQICRQISEFFEGK